MKKNVWVPLVSAGAVGALLVGGAVVSGSLGDSDSGDPPTLALGPGAGGSAAGESTADSRSSSLSVGAASYVLEGTLPDGPTEGSIRRFTARDADARRSVVATALGVDPADPNLSIATDPTGSWSYYDTAFFEQLYPTCGSSELLRAVEPSATPAPDDATSSSAVEVDPCIVEQPDLPPGPDEAKARSIAEPILVALGVPTDDLRVEVGAPTTWISVDPVVDGLPTRGIATSLEVGVDSVVAGNGFLGTTEPGETSPLISAQAAYDQLASQPVPEIAMLCPEPAPLPEPAADDLLVDPATDPAISMPCGYVDPTVITGAELGLTLQYDADDPLLVPSWLFNPDEQYGPSMVAVDPAFITEPEPVDPDAPVDGGGSGSSPASPGTVEPAPPIAEPAPAPEQPASSGLPKAVAVSVDGLTLAITHDSSGDGCNKTGVSVSEEPEQVVVSVVMTVMACPDLVEPVVEQTTEWTLTAPLGTRLVVRSDGTEIPTQR